MKCSLLDTAKNFLVTAVHLWFMMLYSCPFFDTCAKVDTGTQETLSSSQGRVRVVNREDIVMHTLRSTVRTPRPTFGWTDG